MLNRILDALRSIFNDSRAGCHIGVRYIPDFILIIHAGTDKNIFA